MKQLLIILLVIFCFFSLFAEYQNSSLNDTTGYIEVTVGVFKDNKALSKANIFILENNKQIKHFTTNSDGLSAFKLPFNSTFLVKVTKCGLIKKLYEFNTSLPLDVNRTTIYNFSYKVTLYPKYKDIDLSVYNKPFALIKYNNKHKDFYFDYDYAKAFNNMLILTENLMKEYNKFVTKGDKYFIKDKYKKSLNLYIKAIKESANPDIQPKINLLNQYLHSKMDNENLYVLLIGFADLFFGKKEYLKARELYVKTTSLNSQSIYPKNKTEEIDLLLKQK